MKHLYLFLLTSFTFFLNISVSTSQVGNGDFSCSNGSCGGAVWAGCAGEGGTETNPETNYGGSNSSNDVAEVDNQPTSLCQTVSGFTPGNNYTLSLDLGRRINDFTPSTVEVRVCIGSTCRNFTRNNNNWGLSTSSFNFNATASSLLLSITVVDRYTGCSSCQNSYGMIIDNVTIPGLLPVTLLNFTAVKNGSEVDIRWKTATEINNDYFTVEKSKNGIDFTAVDIVDGAGNSQSILSYQVTDPSPYTGISYYHLKQVDYDGRSSYSKIVAVENEEMKIEIYPNPSQGSFKINVINEKQPCSIEVTDAEGRLIYKNRESQNNSSIEINGLAKGLYIVRLVGTNTAVNRKLVVL
jgi:hypothetical protein